MDWADLEAGVSSKCIWIRAFDAHFNIGCANENGQRGTLILKDALYTEKRNGILNTARTAEKKLK